MQSPSVALVYVERRTFLPVWQKRLGVCPTSLDDIGKHHEKFAGLRWVIGFNCYANTDFKKLKTSIDAFELQEEDKNGSLRNSVVVSRLEGWWVGGLVSWPVVMLAYIANRITH